METESRMSARCGKRLLVHSEQGEWKLHEACPDGHQPGTRVGTLLDKCTKCKQAPPMEGRILMAVVERPKKGNGASISAAPLDAEVPLVAPSGVPTVAPPPPPSAATVSIPLAPAFVAPDALPLQPTASTVLPFSVAAEPSSADPVVLPPPAPDSAPAVAPLPASIVSPAPSLPDIGKIVLPGGFSLESMMDPEASVDVDAVVKAGMPNLPGGPSTGGLSPHTLDDAKCWRLFYLRHVLGLKPAAPSRSLQLGSLIHYCLAARYLLGAEHQYQPCTLVAQAGASGLAAEAKALVEGMVAKYGIEEWERWCVRAVEHNLVAFIECPVGGRMVRLPATCRIDLILGLKAPHEPHPAGGPMVEGVYIEDHKCLAADQDVIAGGKLVPAVEMLDREALVPAAKLGQAGTAVSCGCYAAEFADNGLDDVWTVTLKSGRQMRVTGIHPFWTTRGWRSPTQLCSDDFIACLVPDFVGVDPPLDMNTLEAIAILIGDGTITEGRAILSSNRIDLRERFIKAVGANYCTEMKSEGKTGSVYVKHSSPVYEGLKDLNLVGHRAPTKFIPRSVAASTLPTLVKFIGALWSTDGCVSSQSIRGAGDLRICYNTRSSTLARDVQRALWRLGIWSSVTSQIVTYEGVELDYFATTVSGRKAKQLFAEMVAPHITFRGNWTVERLREAVEQMADVVERDPNGIPSELLAPVLAEWGGTKLPDGTYPLPYLSGKRTIGRNLLKRWAAADASLGDGLIPLLDERMTWDRVSSVQHDGVEPTVSISVATSQVFISPDGIVSHNTCSSMTKDLLEGYGLDWQFNAQAVIFEEGGYPAVFGPLRGTLVNLLSKSRKTPTADSFARPQAPMSKGLVAEFRDTQLRLLMGEVYRRISNEEIRKDPAQWSKDYRQCNGRWGRCHYFEICEGGHETVSAAFVDDESLVIHPDKFVRPAGPAAPPAEQVKKEKSKEKAQAKASDPIAMEMARLWGSMLVEQIEANPGGAYANLQRGHFLQPDTTKEKVVVLLGNELKLFYDLFVAQKVRQEWAGATWQFTKTGISWQRTDGGKGRLTWKGLATWICDNVWYDLSQAMPEG